MNSKPSPPKYFHRFFRWFCHPDLLPGVEGDLMELYNERLAKYGKRKADRRFIIDVLLLFRLGIIRPVEGSYHLNSYGMFKNYLKVGVRNILKYKAFSFINVFGLATAMSVCMLIILMLADQRSYDQFHPGKERIYRILSKIPKSGSPNASSPFPLASTLKQEYPLVEDATQLSPGVGGDAVYEEKSAELSGYFADASFFSVFGFELEKGDKTSALTSPNSMVISSHMASFLFGEKASVNPVGKTVRFFSRGLRLIRFDFGSETGTSPVDWGYYTITGVIDSKKYKSHLKFDVLMSAASLPALLQEKKVENHVDDWERYSYSYTYALLKSESSEEHLTSALNSLVAQKYAGIDHLEGIRLITQPLGKITPGSFLGNPPSLQLPIEAYYFLGFLAFVIMLSACLNYTNLSVARALTRAREIGIRKVNGAKRTNLVIQFFTESILTSLLALAMAAVLLVLIKPAFRSLWANQYLSFDLQGNLVVYLIFLGLAIFIGLAAGVYPALHLSGYAPVKALKNPDSMRPGKYGMRKVLTSFQFIVSLFFIVTSILIARQFRHYLEFEYGFTSENIVNIPLQGNDYKLLASEMSTVPGVSAVSACEYIPAVAMTNGIGVRKAGNEGDFVGFEYLRVNQHFVSTLGLSIVEGRNLSDEGDEGRRIIVNETAAEALGYSQPSDIIGAKMEAAGFENEVEVVGVLKDFRFQTPIMEDKTGPLFFINQPEHFSYLNVKLASGETASTLEKLEEKWKGVDQVHPFKYMFFDEQLVNVNRWMGDLVAIIGFIALLAIVISCLGLLGIAIYSTERRVKEIGIRKVLGAESLSLALLLSKQFLRLLIVSIALAAPLSYFVNTLWLQNFPNRVEFGWGTILASSVILLILGLATISSQTLRASRRNPVDALRRE